jgi:Protein of unknown function (DUF2934)
MKSTASPHQGRSLKPDTRNPRAGRSKRVSVSFQEIQVRAYHKLEAMGEPTGKDLKFWLEAQRERKSTIAI